MWEIVMQHYIQRLHDEKREESLVNFMQNAFPDFCIRYNYETMHAGYFTFEKNQKIAIEFVIGSFCCYHFGVNDYSLEKDGLPKEVKKAYVKFMAQTFEEYQEDYLEYRSKNKEINMSP